MNAKQDPNLSVPVNVGPYRGTWLLISSISNGIQASEEEIQNVRVEIMNGLENVWVKGLETVHEFQISIDLSVIPNHTTDYLPDGQQIRGICKIEGDLLTSCVAQVDRDRPLKFESRPGSGCILRVFRRER